MDEQKLWSVRFLTLAMALILAYAVLMFVLSRMRLPQSREGVLALTRQNASSVDTGAGINGDEGANSVAPIGPVTNERITTDIAPMSVPPEQESVTGMLGSNDPLSILPQLPAAIPMPRAG